MSLFYHFIFSTKSNYILDFFFSWVCTCWCWCGTSGKLTSNAGMILRMGETGSSDLRDRFVIPFSEARRKNSLMCWDVPAGSWGSFQSCAVTTFPRSCHQMMKNYSTCGTQEELKDHCIHSHCSLPCKIKHDRAGLQSKTESIYRLKTSNKQARTSKASRSRCLV